MRPAAYCGSSVSLGFRWRSLHDRCPNDAIIARQLILAFKRCNCIINRRILVFSHADREVLFLVMRFEKNADNKRIETQTECYWVKNRFEPRDYLSLTKACQKGKKESGGPLLSISCRRFPENTSEPRAGSGVELVAL